MRKAVDGVLRQGLCRFERLLNKMAVLIRSCCAALTHAHRLTLHTVADSFRKVQDNHKNLADGPVY